MLSFLFAEDSIAGVRAEVLVRHHADDLPVIRLLLVLKVVDDQPGLSAHRLEVTEFQQPHLFAFVVKHGVGALPQEHVGVQRGDGFGLR